MTSEVGGTPQDNGRGGRIDGRRLDALVPGIPLLVPTLPNERAAHGSGDVQSPAGTRVSRTLHCRFTRSKAFRYQAVTLTGTAILH